MSNIILKYTSILDLTSATSIINGFIIEFKSIIKLSIVDFGELLLISNNIFLNGTESISLFVSLNDYFYTLLNLIYLFIDTTASIISPLDTGNIEKSNNGL